MQLNIGKMIHYISMAMMIINSYLIMGKSLRVEFITTERVVW